MKYEISKATAPAMPNLGKGTECVKLLLSQASKDMYEPLVPMLFPSLGAHISGAEFQYPDPRPQLEGNMRHDGPVGGQFGQQQGTIGQLGGSHLP